MLKISSVGTVAGCYIVSGKVERASLIRIVRNGVIINDEERDRRLVVTP